MTEPPSAQQLYAITRDAIVDLMLKMEATDQADVDAEIVAHASLAAFTHFTVGRFGLQMTADLLRVVLAQVEHSDLANMTPAGSA